MYKDYIKEDDKKMLAKQSHGVRLNLAFNKVKLFLETYGSIELNEVGEIIKDYNVQADMLKHRLIECCVLKDNYTLVLRGGAKHSNNNNNSNVIIRDVRTEQNKKTKQNNTNNKTNNKANINVRTDMGKQTEVTKEQQEQIDELLRQYDTKTKQNKKQNKQFKHCCYRFLDKHGNLLYIGRAKDVRDRMKSHEHLGEECYQQISKIQFVSFDNEDDLDIAERYYISKLKPIYNKEFKNKHFSFNLEELDKKQWTTWEQGLELIHRG